MTRRILPEIACEIRRQRTARNARKEGCLNLRAVQAGLNAGRHACRADGIPAFVHADGFEIADRKRAGACYRSVEDRAVVDHISSAELEHISLRLLPSAIGRVGEWRTRGVRE